MELAPAVSTLLVWLLGALGGWLGTDPIGRIIGWLGVSGPWAIVVTYALSFVIGGIGVVLAIGACSIVFIGVCFQPTDFWQLVIAIVLAAQFVFHKRKDEGTL